MCVFPCVRVVYQPEYSTVLYMWWETVYTARGRRAFEIPRVPLCVYAAVRRPRVNQPKSVSFLHKSVSLFFLSFGMEWSGAAGPYHVPSLGLREAR